jgi:hypothetical protein
MFCVPGHVFGANEGDGSRFHVLRVRTRDVSASGDDTAAGGDDAATGDDGQ